MMSVKAITALLRSYAQPYTLRQTPSLAVYTLLTIYIYIYIYISRVSATKLSVYNPSWISNELQPLWGKKMEKERKKRKKTQKRKVRVGKTDCQKATAEELPTAADSSK